jgi:chromosome segregation ATPase
MWPTHTIHGVMQPPRGRYRGSTSALSQASSSTVGRGHNPGFPALHGDSAQPFLYSTTRAQTNKLPSAVVHHHDHGRRGNVTNSYDDDDVNVSRETSSVAYSAASSSPTPQSIPSLSSAVLARLQTEYPAVYTALRVYEKAVRHHKEKFKAKEAELLRCIGAGEELLEQIDALKQRCELLGRERDDAVAAAAAAVAAAQQTSGQDKEHLAPSEAVKAAQVWDAEKKELIDTYEAQCSRLREQLQDALQQTSIANAEQHELEAALRGTRSQLRQAEDRLREMEGAYEERASADAAQRDRDMQQQQLLFQQQIAQVQQQADMDKETVLAEATVELERLQRALVRAEKELKEQQHTSERSTMLLSESGNAATVEMANLRRQVRQLEDANHDLQLQLRRKQPESRLSGRTEEGRLIVVGDGTAYSGSMTSNSNGSTVFSAPSVVGTRQPLQQSLAPGGDVAGGGALSSSVQRHLQEENVRLRDKLHEVSRQAQDEIDAAHEARLKLQQQLKAAETQMQLLRSSVIAGLEQELSQARTRTDVAEVHCRELQEVADGFEARVIALQRGCAEAATERDAARQAHEQLQHEMQELRDTMASLQQEIKATTSEVHRKGALVVQLQREKQQLVVALRTVQAETATIEDSLAEMRAKHEEGVVMREMTAAQLQERCILLEHEVEEAKEERLTLCSRLRDAEEAVDVLKDAQRVAQEVVRDAQRKAREVEDKANAGVEQLRTQQHVWQSRATEAEQERNRLRAQLTTVSQRLRDHQEELAKRDEAVRQSADKAAALTAELRQLREFQLGRDEASRERWRQQYAQNTADREQLLVSKEQQIEFLQQQQRELAATLAERDDRLEHLLQQRQQAQAALSDAVASSATYKGRIQALEEELMRVEKERAEARAELLQLAETYKRAQVTGATTAGGCSTEATGLRVAELEAKLAECEEELRTEERQRQQAQTTLLQLVLPPSRSTDTSANLSSRHTWDSIVEVLDEVVNDLSMQRVVLTNGLTAKEGDDSSPTRLPDACQRAAVAVLRSVRDWVEHLHDGDAQRWAALKRTVLRVYAAHDNEEWDAAGRGGLHPHSGPPSPSAGVDCGDVSSVEQLRERFAAASKSLTMALSDMRTEWATANADLRRAEELLKVKEDHTSHLDELTAALSLKEKECAAALTSLDEVQRKYSEVSRKAAALQVNVDQLRQDVAEREASLAQTQNRLESRSVELQAERAEWLAKWQESLRHREREKSDHESEVQELRSRLVAAEEAATASAGASRAQTDEVQRQLRSQLQEVQKTASMTEVSLRQQVATLTQEKTHAAQGLRSLKKVVTDLEVRVNNADAALQEKDAQLVSTEKKLQEIQRAHQETLANGMAAEAYGQESMANQIASLQLQLRTCRQENEMMAAAHAAEEAELQALRKVNASLESRLSEVEEERAPLRQQLHSLLSFPDT